MKTKVTQVNADFILFEDGSKLYSDHDHDCCENHYINWKDLSLKDFEGLEFDLSNDNFFTAIPGYGIALNPIKGHPVRVAGYGENNGYYSTNLTLVLEQKQTRKFDVTNCQDING